MLTRRTQADAPTAPPDRQRASPAIQAACLLSGTATGRRRLVETLVSAWELPGRFSRQELEQMPDRQLDRNGGHAVQPDAPRPG
jgi:hypothetical protein